MNVAELRDILDDYPDEMEVLLMEQPTWPFEYSIDGVTSRSEMGSPDPDVHEFRGEGEECEKPDCGDDAESWVHKTEPDEEDAVFILEGTQLRYGSKEAWDGR